MGKKHRQPGVPGGIGILSDRLQQLDPDSWAAQILVGFAGSIALSPLMLLPVMVYTYDTVLQYGPDMAGWISSGSLIGLAMATVVVSARTKHWCMARVSVSGLVMMLIFTGFSLVFHHPSILFFLTLLAGFGGGLTQAAVAAVLARTHHTTRAFAIFTFFQFIYPGLGTYFFLRLVEGPGLGFIKGFNTVQSGQLVLIFLALVATPVVGAFRLRTDLQDRETDNTADKMEISLILRSPALLSIIGIMIYGTSNGALWGYSEGIGRRSGLDVYTISDIIAYTNIIAGGAALLITWLGNRLGHYIPLMLSILGQLVSICIYFAWPTQSGYIMGTLVFVVSWATAWPYFLSLQSELDHSGTVVAFGQFTNLVGTSFGPSLAALCIGAKGGFIGALHVSAAMTILTLLPVMLIPVLLYRMRSRSASDKKSKSATSQPLILESSQQNEL